jgi:hypothetical protein
MYVLGATSLNGWPTGVDLSSCGNSFFFLSLTEQAQKIVATPLSIDHHDHHNSFSNTR